jgi:hypothetical protein
MRHKRWFRRMGQVPPPARWYRVEHRTDTSVRSLGLIADVFPHPTTLAPFASRLVADGQTGELVLIDETTETVVARQDRRHGPRRAPGHKRP